MRSAIATSSSTPPRRPAWPGFLWAAVAVLIFSGWFVATRFTMTHALRVWDVLALRFGGGALVLLPVLIASRKRLGWAAWREGFVFACLWGGPFVWLVAIGLRETSAAQASSLTPALMPVFAAGLAWRFLAERPTRSRVAGIAAILAGLVVLIGFGLGPPHGTWITGSAALVLAALMWAIYTIRFRRSGLTAPQSAALMCVWTSVLFLPVYWATGASRLADASGGELAFQAIYQGALMSGVAIVAFNEAVRYLGAAAAAAITAMVPVSATTMAALILHESPSPIGLAAICAIAAGVLLAARPTAAARL